MEELRQKVCKEAKRTRHKTGKNVIFGRGGGGGGKYRFYTKI
jgi:hypothetical protein